LYATAAEAEADANSKVVELKYDSVAGIDLKSLVETHYIANGETAESLLEDVEANGFAYNFELVGSFKGANNTSESAHAAIKDGKIRAQITKDGKQQAWGAEQSRATIGREPIVRVTLLEGKNVVAVGYIKFIIVEKIAEVKTESEVKYNATFTSDLAYTVDCASTAITVKTLTWDNVEEQIYKALGISKAEFEADYSLDGGASDATQYDGVKVDSKEVTADKKVGVVSETTSDSDDDTKTNVLKWVVANNEAYQTLKGANSITVNVRFTKTVNADKQVYDYVYVTFTWTPKTKNVTPNGTVADAAKIDQYWYAQNSASHGYSDIHANVAQVTSSDANDCTFVSDILNTLTGNEITVTNDATYAAWKDAAAAATIEFAAVQDQLTKKTVNKTDYYTATGASGAIYAIQGKGTSLQAAKITGVTVADFADIVTLADGTKLTYAETEDAKDLLNNADHNELAAGKTFTAKLTFKVTDPCTDGPTYKLTNDVFYAKFLRPVSAKPADAGTLNDASNGASTSELSLGLVDWRDKSFDKKADYSNEAGTEVYNFYGFYGLKTITADLDNATTNLNSGTLGTTKLSSITKNVKLTFGTDGVFTYSDADLKNTDPSKVSKASFSYLNNGTTLGTFIIRVPLIVEYKWGKIYTSVDLTINKTVQN
jgi:hypothetical protein